MEEEKFLVLGGKGKISSRVAERLIKLGKNFSISSRSEKIPFDWEPRGVYISDEKINIANNGYRS